ncbi:MAG: glycoside hydrolase family 2 protein [Cytophagales bacterium]|nr:glycoside hydrolase family 2 protein [Cytophaga sp.]
MRNVFLLLFFVVPLLYAPLFAQTRSIQAFNDDWKFIRTDVSDGSLISCNDALWAYVTIPHTWNNLDGQDGGNNYYRGIGWYRKHVSVSQTGKRIFIKFNAANMQTDVYINNTLAGTHTGGYGAFIFEITHLVHSGDNVIAVKVNNAAYISAAPLDADFTFYGGLTQTIELLSLNPVHIDPLDHATSGVYITQHTTSAAKTDIDIKALVKNDQATTAKVTAIYTVSDTSGTTVATAISTGNIIAGTRSVMKGTITIANPVLWNGLSNPYLYKVTTEIRVEGIVTDVVTESLGVRFYTVDVNTGFYLNGSSYRLHGVAHHEDRLDKGRAMSDGDRKEDLELLKELGCNYLRLSHYQHGQYTYDYCDLVGIVLWTEIPLIDNIDPNNSPAFNENAKQQLTELILQNYNHPSVIVWGLSNEITYKNNYTPYPGPLVKELHQLAKQLDSTRLTASAAMFSDEPLNFYSDIYSCNQYNGWYYNELSAFGTWADEQHRTSKSAFGVSEYGAGANTTHHELLPSKKPLHYGIWHPEEYQATFHEAHWQQLVTRPYLWSTSVWVAFDFSSDGRNEGLQAGINDKGLVTRDRKIKKDAYYYYKANWSSQPFVYITSRRFFIHYTAALTAKVYSNCDSVSLTVNTVSLPMKKSTNKIFIWDKVKLFRGKNLVIATGYKNNIVYYDTIYWQYDKEYTISPSKAAIQINFERSNTETPAGFLKDDGSVYGDRGNGYSYGWDANVSAVASERGSGESTQMDTFIPMQYKLNKVVQYNYWKIALPNGYYKVSIAAGDPSYFDSYHAITAEGKVIVANDPVYPPDKTHSYGTDTVLVDDGMLTIEPAPQAGAYNTKINFIYIQPVKGMSARKKIPANESIVITLNSKGDEAIINGIKTNAEIRISDASGNLIKSFSNVLSDPFIIPVTSFPKGVYTIEIKESATNTFKELILP